MPGTLNVGGHDIITHSGDAGAGDVTVNVQNRLVLDSSGNVGVGTSSPAQKLHVEKDGSAVATFRTSNNDSSGGIELCGKNSSGTIQPFYIQSGTSSELKFSQGALGIERMQIDSSGHVLVNASSFEGGSTVGIQLNATNNASNAYAILIKNSDGSEIFQFKCNGSAASSSGGSFGTISDRNLKENIVDATPKLSDVLNLQVRNFNNKSDPNKTKFIGFIAQELETIFPNLVEESVNGIKSVKTSILIPILTKAIQEQQTIIESQQSQIDALTARIEALENA